jgi:hypothetical protein
MRLLCLCVSFGTLICWTGQTCSTERRINTDPSRVRLLRVPAGGIQPQACLDTKGLLHLVYFDGESRGGDLYYVRSDDAEHFSKPIRVNSEPGSAIAVGNIRGAHISIGRNGRVHVAWMGSEKAKPRGPSDSAPMLYARLNDAGSDFQPQRNLIQSAIGLDGGGSVAADDRGNVYVVWHAPIPGRRGEENRCVWMARSMDDGASFAPEVRINPEATGACGCCGMRAHVDHHGDLFVMYRTATSLTHRDMHLLASKDRGATFRNLKLDPWNVRVCPMSSMAFASNDDRSLATWETEGQILFAAIEPTLNQPVKLIAAPGQSRGRKHSAVGINSAGEILLAWTEGMGWNKGGTLVWQPFNSDGKATKERGQVPGVPVWSTVSVVAQPDGQFLILY